MLLKGIFCVCFQAVLLKTAFTQCISPNMYPREPLCTTNVPLIETCNFAGQPAITPFYGRVVGANVIVDTSAPYTPIGPSGVTIFSDDLLIEGTVFVTGNLPFVGTVGLEGIVPASGNSAVSYGCGTGGIGIISEGISGPVTEVVLPGSEILSVGYPGSKMINRL